MEYIAENSIVVALALAVLAGIGAWFGWRYRRRRLALIDTPTLTCAQLADATRTAGTVAGEVVGTAEGNPGTELTGPFSGAPCVWYRTEVVRHYRRRNRSRNGRSTTSRARETIAKNDSHEPFRVADTTGRVTFEPEGVWVDQPVQSLDRFERGGGRRGSGSPGDSTTSQLAAAAKDMAITLVRDSSTIGYSYKEWIIRPGQRVFALGLVRADGPTLTMTRPPDRPYVLSTRSEQEIVKGDLFVQRLSFGGTAVALVAAMGVLVYGLLV